jgi:hypothetical protein
MESRQRKPDVSEMAIAICKWFLAGGTPRHLTRNTLVHTTLIVLSLCVSSGTDVRVEGQEVHVDMARGCSLCRTAIGRKLQAPPGWRYPDLILSAMLL